MASITVQEKKSPDDPSFYVFDPQTGEIDDVKTRGKYIEYTDKLLLNDGYRTFEEREKELKALDEAEKEREKREKNSPFSRWTQFNLEHTSELMWLTLKHPKAHAILLFLVDQMDNYNAVICSYSVLQEVLEISESTVKRALSVLKQKGFIAILKSGTTNVYTINDHVYWKSWGKKKIYSKFPANVVLSLDEQEKEYQSQIKSLRHKEIAMKADNADKNE